MQIHLEEQPQRVRRRTGDYRERAQQLREMTATETDPRLRAQPGSPSDTGAGAMPEVTITFDLLDFHDSIVWVAGDKEVKALMVG
jgi:hypothetical protein